MSSLATDILACEARIAANRRLIALLSRGADTPVLLRQRLLVWLDTVLWQLDLLSLLWDAEDEKAGFRPDQPRHPRGSGPISGRWSGGAGTTVIEGADPAATIIITPAGGPPTDRGQDLLEHEAKGGHTIKLHVGKSETFLIRMVTVPQARTLFYTFYRWRHGSFSSLVAAERLTNSNLTRNADIVNAVATGREEDAFITSTFSSITGQESYRWPQRASSPVRLRTTYGVGTYIRHAPDMPNGFIIITSYPRND